MVAINEYFKPVSNPKIKCPGVSELGRILNRKHFSVIYLYNEGCKHYDVETKFAHDYAMVVRRYHVMLKNNKMAKLEPCKTIAVRVMDDKMKSMLIGRI